MATAKINMAELEVSQADVRPAYERFTVTVEGRGTDKALWRTHRREVDGFDADHLYVTCTLAEAQALARLVDAGRLQRGWKFTGRRAEFMPCDYCGTTGTYSWGACVNGRMTHSGTCYQCEGKGYQDESDMRRNWGYVNHMVSRAFRG